MVKKAIIAVAFAGLVLILSLPAAAWYMNRDSFRHWLVERINRDIAGRITVDDHRLSLWQGRLKVTGVQVRDSQDAVLAEVRSGEVSLAWTALLKREIGLIHLMVDGVRLNLILDDRQRLNLVEALSGTPREGEPGGGEPSNWQVRVDTFRLRNGDILFRQPANALEVRVAPLGMSGSLDMGGSAGQLTADLDTLTIKKDDRGHTVRGFVIRAAYQGDLARPWLVEINTPQSRLTARGQVHPNGNRTELDAMVQASVDLDELQPLISPWLSVETAMQGRLQASLEVLGPVADPRARLDLSIAEAAARGIEVAHLSVQAGLAQRKVALDNISGHGPWGRLDIQGELDLQAMFARDFFDPTGGVDSLVYEVTVSAEALQPGRLPDLPLGWIGTWQGKTHLKGRGFPGTAVNQGRGEADFEVAGIRLVPGASPVNGTIQTKTSWDGSMLEVEALRVEIPSQILVAKGRIDLDAGELAATGDLVSERIEALGQALGIILPQGDAQVNLTADGPLARPRVSATMLARQVRLESYTFGRVLVTAELDSALNLGFPRLVLENQGSYLEGSGRLALSEDDPGVGLKLKFDPLDPADFMDLDLNGRTALSGQLEVSGTIKNPVGQVTLDSSPVVWEAFNAQVQGSARWQSGRLRVAQLRLSKEGSRLDLKGDIRFQDPKSGQWRSDPLLDFNAEANAIRIEDFFSEYRGTLSATASLTGPLSNPKGRFSVRGRRLALNFQDLQRVDVSGRFQERVLHVEDLSIGMSAERSIRGKGFYALDQTFDFRLGVKDLDLNHIQALQTSHPFLGRLDLAIRGRGSIAKPDLSAELTVRNPVFKDQPLQDFHLQAKLQNTRLWVDGRMNFSLQAEGDVSSGGFSLNAAFDKTDLSPWLTMLAGEGWLGRLSGDVEATGNWNDWRRIRADINLRETHLSFKERRLVTIASLQMELRDSIILVPDTRIQILETGYLNVNAVRDATGKLSAKVLGRIPVSAFAPFLEEPEDAEGEVIVEAAASGFADAIEWQADLRLDQVSYVLPYLSQTVQNLNGRIQVTPEQVTITGFGGTIEEGTFSLEGRIGMDGLQPTRGALTLKIDALPLELPDTADVLLNGELTLRGGLDRAVLEGGLVLLEGMYYKDLRLDLWSMVTQPRRGQSVRQARETPQWMESIGLDVELTHRYPFLVDNNVASLEIVPDLKLTGTLGRPVLNGRAMVTEGEVTFRGKKFPVTRGVVDFLNPNRIEPNLDILSQTRIRQWQVSLAISGTPDELVVSLESDPPEAQNDILSLILFGRTNTELASGRGGGGSTTQQMLAGLLASALGENVKETTGVDILEVETGAQNEDDSTDRIQVTVGKRLTPRMTVKYEVETNNGEMIQRAVSEYRFIEQLLASGFQDNKGRYGGELLFRLEFR